MKKIILIFFIISNNYSFSQEIKDIENIFQNILNDESFKAEILSDTTFLCSETLYLFPTENDSLFKNLSFNEKRIILYDINEKINCPVLIFDLENYKNNSYRLKVTVEKVIGKSESCVFYKTKFYQCVLKIYESSYELEDINIGTGFKQAKFL